MDDGDILNVSISKRASMNATSSSGTSSTKDDDVPTKHEHGQSPRTHLVSSSFPVNSLKTIREEERYYKFSRIVIPPDYLMSVVLEHLGPENDDVDGSEKEIDSEKEDIDKDNNKDNDNDNENDGEIRGRSSSGSGSGSGSGSRKNHRKGNRRMNIAEDMENPNEMNSEIREQFVIALSLLAKTFISNLVMKSLNDRPRGRKGCLTVYEIISSKNSSKKSRLGDI